MVEPGFSIGMSRYDVSDFEWRVIEPLWPIVSDSRSGGNQGGLTAVSVLSATARAANSYSTPARVWFVRLFATN